jgi:thiol-disulfide isomerase/thioredoxin
MTQQSGARWFVFGTLLLIVAGGALVFYLQRPFAPDEPASGNPKAPNVQLTMFDGTTRSLDEWKGRPLVLNFWGAWCPPCIVEMPILEESFQVNSETIAFLGIDTQDSRRKALEIIETTGVTYEMAEDPDAAHFNAFEVFAMPTTFFIDSDGFVFRKHSGPIDAGQLTEAIEAMLEAE